MLKFNKELSTVRQKIFLVEAVFRIRTSFNADPDPAFNQCLSGSGTKPMRIVLFRKFFCVDFLKQSRLRFLLESKIRQ